ncbi:MAG: ribonuclease III, partial [Chloroflexota bacterium]|nr:ribonuclease III [Chloroflexota bacterium]
MSVPDPKRLEVSQDIHFDDKTLLQRAFVHRSFLNESGGADGLEDNERLEFLGDSILSFVVSEE